MSQTLLIVAGLALMVLAGLAFPAPAALPEACTPVADQAGSSNGAAGLALMPAGFQVQGGCAIGSATGCPN